jgi:glycosyltransferase involved in cell wall biosynthesis
MRLLHVTPFYEPAWGYGGMARASAGLCRALAHRGHDVTVATVRLDPSHAAAEVPEGVRVRRLDAPGFLSRHLFPWAPDLRRLVLAETAGGATVHLHGHRSGVAWTTWRALQETGTPWVLQTHGTFPHHGQLRLVKRVFDRLAGDRIVATADALVAVSAAEARDLPRAAHVVPNGITLPAARRAPKAAGERRLLFVGTDRPQKRASVLPDLLGRVPGASLDLVGAFRPAFLRRFRRLGGRVVARGVLAEADLATVYAAVHLVVHPAVGESFGLVPFEAALQGTASVVAGGHGCGEWFAKAGGCVVAPDDDGALAAAVGERLRDPGLAAREASAVAEFVRQELTWDRAALAMEAVYRESLASRRGAA